MGQDGKIVNVDKKVEFYGGKISEQLVDGGTYDLLKVLQVPAVAPCTINIPALLKSKAKHSGSPLITIPQELVDQIVRWVDISAADLISLAMTCSYFFRLLAPIVRVHLIRDTAPWAGDRLIYIGDYARSIPDCLGTAEERALWSSAETPNPLWYLQDIECGIFMDEDYGEMGGLGHISFRGDEEFPGVYGLHPHALLKGLYCRINRKKSELDLVRNLLTLFVMKPREEAVLRNLTAKQYVRDSTIASSEFAHSLGNVIYTLAHWTDDNNGMLDLSLHGEWAGHAMDIASPEDVSDDEWQDVSAKAVKNLEAGTGRKMSRAKGAESLAAPREFSLVWDDLHFPWNRNPLFTR